MLIVTFFAVNARSGAIDPARVSWVIIVKDESRFGTLLSLPVSEKDGHWNDEGMEMRWKVGREFNIPFQPSVIGGLDRALAKALNFKLDPATSKVDTKNRLQACYRL